MWLFYLNLNFTTINSKCKIKWKYDNFKNFDLFRIGYFFSLKILRRVLEGEGLDADELAFEELNSNENNPDELNADELNADELNADELNADELNADCSLLNISHFVLCQRLRSIIFLTFFYSLEI